MPSGSSLPSSMSIILLISLSFLCSVFKSSCESGAQIISAGGLATWVLCFASSFLSFSCFSSFLLLAYRFSSSTDPSFCLPELFIFFSSSAFSFPFSASACLNASSAFLFLVITPATTISWTASTFCVDGLIPSGMTSWPRYVNSRIANLHFWIEILTPEAAILSNTFLMSLRWVSKSLLEMMQSSTKAIAQTFSSPCSMESTARWK
mmetsp:Transcript_40442/g.79717  ORF Transcript_40442/g.79717 Transcript_40442/m.79717 type:complete len:207 (-) Transcript_40442:932-1552(-)